MKENEGKGKGKEKGSTTTRGVIKKMIDGRDKMLQLSTWILYGNNYNFIMALVLFQFFVPCHRQDDILQVGWQK